MSPVESTIRCSTFDPLVAKLDLRSFSLEASFIIGRVARGVNQPTCEATEESLDEALEG